MANDKLVLITGATGQQGGATARELLAKGWKLRAMTRKPDGDAAKALAKAGVEIVQGDLDDDASLAAALKGVWGVYGVQNTWEAGVEREEEQGKRLAKVARDAGVQHYVYASVASAQRQTGIPHFENKWRVEETVRSLKFPSHVIVRPVFFMENLVSPWFLHGDTLGAGMDPKTSLQMIAVADIGKYGALAFERANELAGAELDIAGDAATMPQAAAALGEALSKKLTFVQYPIAEVRKQSEDMALMLEWFDRVGYNADIDGNARKYGIRPTKLAEWARTQAKR
ncbi:MAG TPA: NmrA/HSCARG family protein [Kofleriaceae bacterium]|nr:NmrA/HSCARG family protein [Kofleriaceae bacterium]